MFSVTKNLALLLFCSLSLASTATRASEWPLNCEFTECRPASLRFNWYLHNYELGWKWGAGISFHEVNSAKCKLCHSLDLIWGCVQVAHYVFVWVCVCVVDWYWKLYSRFLSNLRCIDGVHWSEYLGWVPSGCLLQTFQWEKHCIYSLSAFCSLWTVLWM